MKEIKLFEISNPKQWKNLPSKELLEEGFPVYGANGIIGSYHEYTHEKPTIVITCRGATSGTINKTLPKSFITSNAMVLDDLKENTIYIDYLFYALKNRGFNDVITGSAQPQITRESLKNVSFKIPKSYEDQIKIANVLERIENLITERQNTIDLIDELVKATFYQMFGDPVKNEKGWDKDEIGDIANIGTGSTPSRNKESEYYNGTIPWIKTTEVNGNKIFDSQEKITDLAIFETNCKVYPVDTILLAMYGQGRTRGNVALLKIEAATNQACAAILPNEILNQVFLFYYLKNSYSFIRSLARGGNQENLNLSIVRDIQVFIPPITLQNKFAAIAQKIENIKAEQEAQKKVMEELYASITHKVFNDENFDLSRVPFDASLLPKEEDLIAIEKEILQKEKLPKERVKKTEIVNYKRKETSTNLNNLSWENISFEFVANAIKSHFQQVYFNAEMLLRFLTDDLGIEVNYFSSAEQKKNQQLENADDFYTFILGAVTGNNAYLQLEQVFYNAVEENIKDFRFKVQDLKLLIQKNHRERSGIYFRIKEENS
ncbi:restriction endonuclease subunit S [Flavobacterium oreochromis]|uniref:Restriction endonuclease subunit S n=1 Tax=Flavobacterium oreochromis TaxID=2906078 RepID=A0ABW8PBC4_9FLAO